ncbi:MAG: methyltransferase domain-containing protein [Acidimicrobiia bacterium]
MVHSHENPSVMDEAFWNERYRSRSQEWSGRPHPHLVTEAKEMTPGSALDVGTGEGADAIWLAEQGWRVTAVDISSVALERGATQADRIGAEIAGMITWKQADLTEWTPPVGEFDLVTAQYFHLPSAQQIAVYEGLADSVAPGGVLLIVGHHPSDLETTAWRMPDPDPLFTADEVADELGEGWNILASDARARTERDRSGDSITVHDAVLVARRNT